MLCANGLTGIKESIATAFLEMEYQSCIVHQVRNTLKRVAEKWANKHPNAMKRWEDFWDSLMPIFKFSSDVRKVMYTTNTIESINSAYRHLNSQRSIFPTVASLQKALYLATWEAMKKWTMPLRNWGKVCGELSIMYESRMPE